jgi:hypothetical protein
LGDASLGGLEGDEVHPVELVANVAPGVADTVLDDPDKQQREPAELDVASYSVLAVMENRSQPKDAFHIAPTSEGGQARRAVGRATRKGNRPAHLLCSVAASDHPRHAGQPSRDSQTTALQARLLELLDVDPRRPR